MSAPRAYALRVRDAAQVVQVCAAGERVKRREEMQEVAVLPNATVIVGRDGLVVDVGPADVLSER